MITSNHFTTFIQSWWVKPTVLFSAVCFLFFSCGDDLNTIGFKPDENRFKVSYKEIDLPSAVFLTDPLITSNVGGDGLTPRLLIGSYTDEKFGKIKSEAFFQIRPSTTNGTLPANATLSSLVLNLSFDYYRYGTTDPLDMNFYVHELTDSLITGQTYTPDANIDYSPTIIGQGVYGISPSSFDEKRSRNTDADATNDAIDTLSINIGGAYADALFQAALGNSNDYILFNKFARIFKGLAISSDATTQIIGINPSYTASTYQRSRLILYYNYTDDTGAARKGKLEYFLYSDPAAYASVSFSKIKADRSGTSLEEINSLYKDFYPDGDRRFVQSGDLVITKFDISNFFSFADTIPNMLINSAEIAIDPIEDSPYKAPTSLALRLLNVKNRSLVTSDTISSSYTGLIVSDKDGNLILGQGTGASAVIRTLVLSTTNNVSSYKGLYTNYFQMLYSLTDHTKRFTKYALVSADPSYGRSVNRFTFNKSNLKLRIYYTTPATKKE